MSWCRSVVSEGGKSFVTEKSGGRLMSDISEKREFVANLTSVHGLYSKGQAASGTAQCAVQVLTLLQCANLFTII